MAKKSTSYGWLAMLSAFMIAIILQGTLGNQMGLLLEPVCSDLGVARTMFSTLMSLTTIVNFLCSLTFAKFLSTLGIKKMSIIGALGAVLYCVLLVVAGRFTGTAALSGTTRTFLLCLVAFIIPRISKNASVFPQQSSRFFPPRLCHGQTNCTVLALHAKKVRGLTGRGPFQKLIPEQRVSAQTLPPLWLVLPAPFSALYTSLSPQRWPPA